MDWDQFEQSLLGDASSLAGYATAAGAGAIQSDITGYNVTPSLLNKLDGFNVTTAANSSLLMLLLIGALIYFVVKEK